MLLPSLEPDIWEMTGAAALLLALLEPVDVSALLPSALVSTFTVAAVVGSPSVRGVVEVEAPFPVLDAALDYSFTNK